MAFNGKKGMFLLLDIGSMKRKEDCNNNLMVNWRKKNILKQEKIFLCLIEEKRQSR